MKRLLLVCALFASLCQTLTAMDPGAGPNEDAAAPSSSAPSRKAPRCYFEPPLGLSEMAQLKRCAVDVKAWVFYQRTICEPNGTRYSAKIREEKSLFALNLSPGDHGDIWLPESDIGKALNAPDWNTFCAHVLAHVTSTVPVIQDDPFKLVLSLKDVSFLPKATLNNLYILVLDNIFPGASLEGFKTPDSFFYKFLHRVKDEDLDAESVLSSCSAPLVSEISPRFWDTTLIPLSIDTAVDGNNHFFCAPPKGGQTSRKCLVAVPFTLTSENLKLRSKTTAPQEAAQEDGFSPLLALPSELTLYLIKEHLGFVERLSLMQTCSHMWKHVKRAGFPKVLFSRQDLPEYPPAISLLEVIQGQPDVPVVCCSFDKLNVQIGEASETTLHIDTQHAAWGEPDGPIQWTELIISLRNKQGVPYPIQMRKFFTSSQSMMLWNSVCIPRLLGIMSKQLELYGEDEKSRLQALKSIAQNHPTEPSDPEAGPCV